MHDKAELNISPEDLGCCTGMVPSEALDHNIYRQPEQIHYEYGYNRSQLPIERFGPV